MMGALLAAVLFYTAIAVPVAEANVWEERRQYAQAPAMDAGARSIFSGISQVLPAASALQLAGDAQALPGGLGALPYSYGRVQKIHVEPGSRLPLVVLIQDAHQIETAQKNVARILNHIQEEMDRAEGRPMPLIIGKEGARGAYNLAKFRNIRFKEMQKEVNEILLAKSFINGAEYFGVSAEKEPLLWGVENETSYAANVQAYQKGQEAAAQSAEMFGAMESAIHAAKTRVYSKEMMALDRVQDQYEAQEITLTEFLEALGNVQKPDAARYPSILKFFEALKLERGLDFKKVERERNRLSKLLSERLDKEHLRDLVQISLSYRAGRIGTAAYYRFFANQVGAAKIDLSDFAQFDRYVRYAMLTERIASDALFKEVESFKDAIQDRLARGAEEKDLLRQSSLFRLVRKMSRCELNPVEWKTYESSRAEILKLQKRFGAVSLDAILPVYESFYRASDRRNSDMVKNLLAKIENVRKTRSQHPPMVALIAGGFHTAGIQKEMEASKMSYVTLSPGIGEVYGKGTDYLQVFSVDPTPLEKMLLGEKVLVDAPNALAAKPMAGVAVADRTKMVENLNARLLAAFGAESGEDADAIRREIREAFGIDSEVDEVEKGLFAHTRQFQVGSYHVVLTRKPGARQNAAALKDHAEAVESYWLSRPFGSGRGTSFDAESADHAVTLIYDAGAAEIARSKISSVVSQIRSAVTPAFIGGGNSVNTGGANGRRSEKTPFLGILYFAHIGFLVGIYEFFTFFTIDWGRSNNFAAAAEMLLTTVMMAGLADLVTSTLFNFYFKLFGKTSALPRKDFRSGIPSDHRAMIAYMLLSNTEQNSAEAFENMAESYLNSLDAGGNVSAVLVSASNGIGIIEHELVQRDAMREKIRETLRAEFAADIQDGPRAEMWKTLRSSWRERGLTQSEMEEAAERHIESAAKNFMYVHRTSRVLKKPGQYQDLMVMASNGGDRAFAYTDPRYGALARLRGQIVFGMDGNVINDAGLSDEAYRQKIEALSLRMEEDMDAIRSAGRTAETGVDVSYRYTMVMDKDNTLPAGSLLKLVETAAANPDRGLLQPRTAMAGIRTWHTWKESLTFSWASGIPAGLFGAFGRFGFYGKGLINNGAYIRSVIGTESDPIEALPIDTMSHDTIEALYLNPAYVEDVRVMEEPTQNYFSRNEQAVRWMTGDIKNSIFLFRSFFNRHRADPAEGRPWYRNWHAGHSSRPSAGAFYLANLPTILLVTNPIGLVWIAYRIFNPWVDFHNAGLQTAMTVGVILILVILPKCFQGIIEVRDAFRALFSRREKSARKFVSSLGTFGIALLDSILSPVVFFPDMLSSHTRLARAVKAVKTGKATWRPQDEVEREMSQPGLAMVFKKLAYMPITGALFLAAMKIMGYEGNRFIYPIVLTWIIAPVTIYFLGRNIPARLQNGSVYRALLDKIGAMRGAGRVHILYGAGMAVLSAALVLSSLFGRYSSAQAETPSDVSVEGPADYVTWLPVSGKLNALFPNPKARLTEARAIANRSFLSVMMQDVSEEEMGEMLELLKGSDASLQSAARLQELRAGLKDLTVSIDRSYMAHQNDDRNFRFGYHAARLALLIGKTRSEPELNEVGRVWASFAETGLNVRHNDIAGKPMTSEQSKAFQGMMDWARTHQDGEPVANLSVQLADFTDETASLDEFLREVGVTHGSAENGRKTLLVAHLDSAEIRSRLENSLAAMPMDAPQEARAPYVNLIEGLAGGEVEIVSEENAPRSAGNLLDAAALLAQSGRVPTGVQITTSDAARWDLTRFKNLREMRNVTVEILLWVAKGVSFRIPLADIDRMIAERRKIDIQA